MMRVDNYMTANVITIDQDSKFIEAMEKMEQHQIRHLLVMDGEKLVGIVTLTDLYRVSPSPANALSNHELPYLLDKLKVKHFMTKKLEIINPLDSIKVAAKQMLENRISCLPVINDGRLVGVITETDVLRAIMME
ncbi:MAG: CBS domain-containing protein [Bacillota bacterium]|nr:CBS domain-containing protein [Bacillota bacterium]